jgi:hypothetical protein
VSNVFYQERSLGIVDIITSELWLNSCWNSDDQQCNFGREMFFRLLFVWLFSVKFL